MGSDNSLLAAVVIVGGGYLLLKKADDVIKDANPLNDLGDVAKQAADGVNTPGGLLGKDSATDLAYQLSLLFGGAKKNADLLVKSAQTVTDLSIFQPVQQAGYDIFGNLQYLYGYGGGAWGAGWVANPDTLDTAAIASRHAAYDALIAKGYTPSQIVGNSQSVANILGQHLITAYGAEDIPQPYLDDQPGAINPDVFAPIKKFVAKIQEGLNTPGGLLGVHSQIDLEYQVQQEINAINAGLATPGGLIGAQSATDIGYQIEQLYKNVLGWF